MGKKVKTFLFLFLVVFAALLFNTTCQPTYPKVEASHYVDTLLSRNDQVKKCASCHKQQFESWKAGPHANAYRLLKAHDSVIKHSPNFPERYSPYVSDKMENICSTCHTGQNIFETNFAGIAADTNPDSITAALFPKAFEQAYSRLGSGNENAQSGVDCMTCHLNGQQVVSNENSKAADTSGIIKSRLFSNNLSCYSCHHHQVSSMKELADKKEISVEVKCVNCHQEYTADGRGTHYFYWRNDAPHKKRPAHLNIFNGINVVYQTNNAVGELVVSWTNTMMPHGFSECGEAKCTVVAEFANGRTEVISELYLNRKSFFDKIDKMPEHFRIGKVGNDFTFKQPFTQIIPLKNEKKLPVKLILKGFVKPQYWSNEKEFLQVYEKVVPFETLPGQMP